MAKKRQRKKAYKPPNPKLGSSFNCPECGRKKVVEVKFNKRENKGYLRCRGCGVEFNTKLKRATTPIDIYYSWIDHRDEEKEQNYSENNKEKEADVDVDVDNGENEENEIEEDDEREQEQENYNENEEEPSQEKEDADDDEDDEDYQGSD